MTIRILIVFSFFSIFSLVLLARLFYWQVLRHEELTALSKGQSLDSISLMARRGEILSSDGYSISTNTLSYLLYANPKLIKDKKYTASKLSEELNIDVSTLSASLSKDLFWVKIKNNLDIAQKSKIEALNINGLGFQEMSTRYYPEGSMAAQLIGFVGRDELGKDRGYFGIEGFYDGQLSGRSGELQVVHDAFGNTILNDIREEKKIDGRNLKLSLDRTVQYIVEQKLKDGVEKYEADGGSAILMEPETGKIIAMVSFPSFDPQKYYEYDSTLYKNPVVSNLFEPGSTFKVLIMAAGIDAKAVGPDSRCSICSKEIEIGEYSIKTWNNKYFPNTTMTDVIIHSDNTGMVYVGQKLGSNKLLSYIKDFGIGELTGVDLQGEIIGGVKDDTQWYPIDLATLTFGQGISVTPIQLITAINSIANDGLLVTPYVVSQILSDSDTKIDIKPKIRRRVVSDTTASVVKEMMVLAVEKGEAKWTRINNYKIAGKTGTAQIPVAGHYDPNQTIASFIGFFPADDPKVTMLIVLDRPKARIFGSETAAPIFFNIARELINYYNIPPDY